MLFHLEPDKALRVVLPCSSRKPLYDTLHSGKCGGHLREAKLHSEISCHLWWRKMLGDIAKWCKTCIVCIYYMLTGKSSWCYPISSIIKGKQVCNQWRIQDFSRGGASTLLRAKREQIFKAMPTLGQTTPIFDRFRSKLPALNSLIYWFSNEFSSKAF